MAEKLFYTMGEVAEMFDVNTSLIRHWEAQFPMLQPRRNKKGNRLFTPRDIEHLKMIYHLVKECGMTLEGAKKALRKGSAATDSVERDAELMERLQRIRSLLVEVREDLKAGEGELVDEGVAPRVAAAPVAEPPAAECRRRIGPVVKFGPEPEGDDAASDGDDPDAAADAEKGAGRRPGRAARKPRRRKEEVENKELFAFYEQSLF